MGRQRSPVRDEAKKLWLESNKSILLKDIASQLNVSESQIRKWKNQDKWEKVTLPKNNKSNVTFKRLPKSQEKKQLKELELNEVELTEKQKLFCLYYIKNFNATLAAIKSGYASDSAHVTGHDLLRNPKVSAEIRRLKGEIQEDLFVDAMDVLNKYIKIAFADISDYVTFGQKEVQVIGMYGPVFDGKGKDKKPVMQTINYVDLKNSDSLDGSIISEIAQGREGVKIKLADKMKALEMLSKYFDLFPDKFKRRIEEERLKIAARKTGDEPEEDASDDGFIDALKGEVKEVWDDEA